ncbi:MAG: hypothetical protein COV52_04595 [Gammaproteobacteria bacterium CG11_big_fil_rev_8_21_14_0_20_46_22]|nr:MAG: hypothetical protein COW05_02785 [Gammaproteobacteria bacterium CG12_big_fil_rev_8_21_14_0_65_46_12]PIR11334.1 MAG: hypothetical protein COV52_04595 [Gammaproteobacteria bacterium CG11_big_fil_rev_8_21_14_0_20_46_22]
MTNPVVDIYLEATGELDPRQQRIYLRDPALQEEIELNSPAARASGSAKVSAMWPGQVLGYNQHVPLGVLSRVLKCMPPGAILQLPIFVCFSQRAIEQLADMINKRRPFVQINPNMIESDVAAGAFAALMRRLRFPTVIIPPGMKLSTALLYIKRLPEGPLRLVLPLSEPLIEACCADRKILPEGVLVELDPAMPTELAVKLVRALRALRSFSGLCFPKNISQATAIACAQVLGPQVGLWVAPDMEEELMVAAIKALNPRATLWLDPRFNDHLALAEKYVSSLPPGGSVYLPCFAKRELILACAQALPSKCTLELYTRIPRETVLECGRFTKGNIKLVPNALHVSGWSAGRFFSRADRASLPPAAAQASPPPAHSAAPGS